MTATDEPPHTNDDVTAHEAGAERVPQAGTTTQKDSEWTQGENVMTAAQASDLKTLADQAREPEAFSARLTKGEASKRIEALKAKLKLMDGPPHTL